MLDKNLTTYYLKTLSKQMGDREKVEKHKEKIVYQKDCFWIFLLVIKCGKSIYFL